MTDLFVYGTLRHDALMTLIAGPGPAVGSPAQLPGFAVDRQPDAPLPMLVERDGAMAVGVLWRGVSEGQLARLDAYETPFGYVRVAVELSGGIPAQTYVPPPGLSPTGRPWSMEEWEANEAPLTLSAAAEIAAHVPPLTGPALAAQWGMIRHRACARARATVPVPATLRSRPQPAETVDVAPLAGSFFKFRKFSLRHTRFDGQWSDVLHREVFQGVDAALVLPYDPRAELVLLVEQFRTGPFVRGDANPWTLEPVAGIVDAGETPQEAARREAMEEAGLPDLTLLPMFEFYPSPGGSTDHFYCYAGLADLVGHAPRSGGLDEEHEDLRLHVVPFVDALALIDTGEITAGPLITMLYWIDRNRARLAALSPASA